MQSRPGQRWEVIGIDLELPAFADLAAPVGQIQRSTLNRHRHHAVPALLGEHHDDFRPIGPPPRRRDIRLLLTRIGIQL
jgi:hypothetical protein